MDSKLSKSLALGVIFQCLAALSVQSQSCVPAGFNCTLPDCFCPGFVAPGGLDSTIDTVPQIVMLTFDDAVTVLNHALFEDMMHDRVNPNGAKASATFFVSHEYNNYQLTHALYASGHEIALHSITHQVNTMYWANLNETGWSAEICGQKRQMAHFAKIPEDKITGFRAPFLQTGGDRQFWAMTSAACDLEYDSSRSTTTYAGTNPEKLWPYTQDFPAGFPIDCSAPACPEEAYPGFWSVRMISYFGDNGFPCAMVDTCLPVPETAEEMYDLLKRNFDNHYVTPSQGGIGNRAPFPIFTHMAYVQGEDNAPRLEGFVQFLDYLGTLPDVYMVSVQKALAWMRNPVALPDVADFPAWNDALPTNQCTSAFPCGFTDDQTPFPGERYMTACQPCPPLYPWLDNPLGAN